MFIDKARGRYIHKGSKSGIRPVYDIYTYDICSRCKAEFNERKTAKHQKPQQVSQRWGSDKHPVKNFG